MDSLDGRPDSRHTQIFGEQYVRLTAKWNNLAVALEENKNDSTAFFRSIPDEKAEFRYQAGKWSVKELILHLAETERIFQYRALRFSRKDATPLSGFDEDAYVVQNNASSRSLSSIIEEFEAVRNSTICLYKGMNAEMADFVGTANNTQVSARTIGWMAVGHVMHHVGILRERYLD